MRNFRQCLAGLAVLAMTSGLPAGSAHAIDGVIEINADRANVGGITPGDTPGMPVTISQPGSYRLTSNLAGALGISVNSGVDNVTIDLNGFRVDGGSAVGPGIRGRARTTVMNGIVSNYTVGACIHLDDESRVIGVQTENCNGGIRVGAHSMVLRSTALNHTSIGVATGFGSRVSGVVSELNSSVGIDTGASCLASGNVSRGNASGTGVSMDAESLAIDNLAAGNLIGVSVGDYGVASSNNGSSSTVGNGVAAGDGSVISGNSTANNVGRGVSCNEGCVVRNNTASSNSSDGILLQDGSVASHNVASENDGDGIECNMIGGRLCGVVGNSLISNDERGLRFIAITAVKSGAFQNNTINANSLGDVTPGGLDPGFGNGCSGTVPCP